MFIFHLHLELVYLPEIQLRASTATGVDRELVLLRELFEESEGMALAVVGSLQLLQQEYHCITDQTQHVGAGEPLKGQRSQPRDSSRLLHPIDHCFPCH